MPANNVNTEINESQCSDGSWEMHIQSGTKREINGM